MKLNRTKWTEDRLAVEARIKSAKAILRTSGHMGSPEEWKELGDAKFWAMQLYKVRAHLHGKIHQRLKKTYVAGTGVDVGTTKKVVVERTLEDQGDDLAGLHLEYVLPEEPEIEMDVGAFC